LGFARLYFAKYQLLPFLAVCTYWAASAALEPSPRGWAITWGRPYLGRDDPGQLLLVGPSTTRPYTNTSPPSLVVNEVKQEAEMCKIEYKGKKECGRPRCTGPFLDGIYPAFPG